MQYREKYMPTVEVLTDESGSPLVVKNEYNTDSYIVVEPGLPHRIVSVRRFERLYSPIQDPGVWENELLDRVLNEFTLRLEPISVYSPSEHQEIRADERRRLVGLLCDVIYELKNREVNS